MAGQTFDVLLRVGRLMVGYERHVDPTAPQVVKRLVSLGAAAVN
jgi:hypothetical protein